MGSSRRILRSEEICLIGKKQTIREERTGQDQAGGALDNDSSPRGPDLPLQDIENIKREAYAQGLNDGQAASNAQLQGRLKSLEDLIRNLEGLKHRLIREAEEECLSLAIAVAEKVLQQEITINRDYIRGILKGVINSLAERENIKIKLNPIDYGYLTQAGREYFNGAGGLKGLVLEEDSSIGLGGAIIETSVCEIDARIERQLEGITKELVVRTVEDGS